MGVRGVIIVGIIGFSILTALYIYLRNRRSQGIDWGDIDQEIKPLIKMLHAYGIVTNESCSGHGHRLGHIEIDEKSYRIEYDDCGKQFLMLLLRPKNPGEFRKSSKRVQGD
jgi:hypothetical protein